ncbi:hypothetical protein HS088_TW22G00126 [Tripterygium wilfordii]|uniref:Uncharacterized protein n=1 Tax=Tripterygium wilfordii TaxID=458696 RepID=A0A7J7BX94_TRIWF|nr:uncharacterized protein LOC119992195 [Tripterygium wilfordii]KAF5726448.1 hypothetical protein HS088_TW22G00126 [Tripterygium wilfordii]
MGNCFTSNKIQVQEETIDPQVLQGSRSEIKKNVEGENIKKKKMVRFKLQEQGSCVDEGGHGQSKDGAVRIRVLLTKEELKQILNCKQGFKDSSLEQFLNVMKLRKRIGILEARRSDGGFNGNWRPTLESIPEDL